MATVLIGLGSNLGDRHATIRRALEILGSHPGISISKVSDLREYPPAGGNEGDPPFVNAAALLHTNRNPLELLKALQATELSLGRKRTIRWGPRTIDLDILLYDDTVCMTQGLTIPHSRLAGRVFALEPAVEIAADLVHPVCGMTIAACLAQLHNGLPWIALAPDSFGWTQAKLACAGPARCRENSPAATSDRGQHLAVQVADAAVRLVRTPVKMLLFDAPHVSVNTGRDSGNGPWLSSTGSRPSDIEDRTHERVWGLQDEQPSNCTIVLTTAWEPCSPKSALPVVAKESQSQDTLPRLVVFGPRARGHLSLLAHQWQSSTPSPISSQPHDTREATARSVEREPGFHQVRQLLEFCRGRVPIVFMEAGEVGAAARELAGILEGAIPWADTRPRRKTS